MKKSKSKAAANLDEREWNFSDRRKLPDNELVPCCYWEYARESAFVRSVRERCHQIAGCGLDFAERQQYVGADFRKMRNVLGRTAHLFQEGFYGLGGTTHHPNVVSPFPQPWQALDKKTKRVLQETVEWTPRMVVDFPAFRWSHFLRATALAERLRKTHPHPKDPNFPLEPDTGSLDNFFWSGDIPRTNRPSFMYATGLETLFVEIDWTRNNDTIIQCFRKWLKAHRPKNVKVQNQRGHKQTDWRARLQRLGYLRLRHLFTLDETLAILAKLPPDQRKTTKFVEPGECNREVEKALTDFHELLPFLDPAENPLSRPLK